MRSGPKGKSETQKTLSGHTAPSERVTVLFGEQALMDSEKVADSLRVLPVGVLNGWTLSAELG